MIEWEGDARTLRVTDADNAAVEIGGTAFTVEGPGDDIPRPVDETVVATARTIEFPHTVVYAFALGADDRYELGPGDEPISLPAGEYVVDIDTEIKCYLRFSGRARIHRTPDFESVVVTFPTKTRVVIGLRSRHELPAGTITVPDSPEALATAVTHLASSHKTTGPDRTYPTLRGHPPLLETGSSLSVPDVVREATVDSGIELVVPAEYESLYAVAPLAYYLQAKVQTPTPDSNGQTLPQLRIPTLDVEKSLEPIPTLEEDVTRLLRSIFFLDCLVRNAGPYGTTLDEATLLDPLGFDPETLYEATPERRLARYLEVPFSAIEHRLPEWHLSTYVTPEYNRITALPYLLDRLSLIYTPRTSALEGTELIERSLNDFYRGRQPSRTAEPTGSHRNTDHRNLDRSNARQAASVEIVKPDLRHGRVHGWLADGVPIDVFKSTPEAYENRLEFIKRDSDSTSIRVVLNDPEMAGEHEAVANIYRQRSRELPIDVAVEVEESLRCAELADRFESEHDFVHYIGHCDRDGLRCPDGNLSMSSLDRSRVQTFFLNACGSFHEGMTLIEKGSAAGAVTFTKVLNEHAVKVGSMFAKLLVHGFSIERAIRLARRRIMMGKDYAVVGDGTHSLTQGEHRVPTTITVKTLESDTDEYFVTFDCYSTRVTGSYYFPHTPDNDRAYLCGQRSHFRLYRQALAQLLKETEAAVVYNGDIYWSTELCDEFG